MGLKKITPSLLGDLDRLERSRLQDLNAEANIEVPVGAESAMVSCCCDFV